MVFVRIRSLVCRNDEVQITEGERRGQLGKAGEHLKSVPVTNGQVSPM